MVPFIVELSPGRGEVNKSGQKEAMVRVWCHQGLSPRHSHASRLSAILPFPTKVPFHFHGTPKGSSSDLTRIESKIPTVP